MDNAADRPAVVGPRYVTSSVGRKASSRANHCYATQNRSDIRTLPSLGSLNQLTTNLRSSFMGPDPRLRTGAEDERDLDSSKALL